MNFNFSKTREETIKDLKTAMQEDSKPTTLLGTFIWNLCFIGVIALGLGIITFGVFITIKIFTVNLWWAIPAILYWTLVGSYVGYISRYEGED